MAHGEYTHIEIPADDPGRAQRFYEGLFGWRFVTIPEFPDYFLYTTPAGEAGVGGAIGRRGETAPDEVRNYVAVDSVDDAADKAQELGGTLVQGKAEVPGQGWYAVITDTEGNRVALWQSLPR